MIDHIPFTLANVIVNVAFAAFVITVIILIFKKK
jgi:hypothetical protein